MTPKLGRWLGISLRQLIALLMFPVRVMLAIRRSATAASVTLLLVGILSLNILWGYPWIGLFAACVSTMTIGWGVNWWMSPRLKIGFSLPPCVEAGQVFSVRIHLRNRRSLPALQLTSGFVASETRSLFRQRRLFRKSRFGVHNRYESFELQSDNVSVPVIGPHELVSIEASLRFSDRGVQRLPRVRVRSLFPFCLFKSSAIFPSGATIAVSPRLLSESDDAVASGQLSELSRWARRFKASEAYDYAGSREYEVGMPVRRWDFASWARLGRPIVREFHSPGVRTAILFVDTAPSDAAKGTQRDEGVERVLSFAATAVTELRQRAIQVQMMITGEEVLSNRTRSSHHASDLQDLLIRLAKAKYTMRSESDKLYRDLMQAMPNQALLVLTSRQDFAPELQSASCKFFRVDMPHADPAPSTARVRNNASRREAPV
ncbi:DUF58 domain-containing protein [Novipirellula artificiosorum]|uniref:DUF58 domain-containing protein n=1 Tax=Novipirellula artificiosorum TaxID=2528016 RepID=A0A5C6E114_9BACT|nr:DUF58 domain-containing protein [Novipirellula artificiosorum]TWU42598.1 hypothetical protein Poly41_08960 [Novipirellula artificiosorum]